MHKSIDQYKHRVEEYITLCNDPKYANDFIENMLNLADDIDQHRDELAELRDKVRALVGEASNLKIV
jgi:phage shock protein A